ncbi:hypothetical protein BJ878DRAFT_483855 [Calycina marina]|uniref:Glycine-rich protein n=1 Tax=Calycina marina TaxID=1763456 RepID=A0A9P8CAZ2_9HELO|nr:hypothetical protein BJ878DRAFT_483855 [Calycina marina]
MALLFFLATISLAISGPISNGDLVKHAPADTPETNSDPYTDQDMNKFRKCKGGGEFGGRGYGFGGGRGGRVNSLRCKRDVCCHSGIMVVVDDLIATRRRARQNTPGNAPDQSSGHTVTDNMEMDGGVVRNSDG